MTLMDEINALRKDLDEVRRKQSKAEPGERAADAEAAPQADAGGIEQPEGLDALLGAVNAAVEDFSEEIEKYPRIAAITTLAVGLALGYAIGRQVR
jgi:hypothetical protein